MKIDLFQSCGHCWVFQICWYIDYSTLILSSFRILNSSTGIPSPPPALFIAMLPNALTSHSRMSDSRWVTTPPWLSRPLRPFLCSSSVYSWHLFWFCYVLAVSVLYCAHLCMNCSLGISNFPAVISSLSLSIFSSISLHWSLREAFLSVLLFFGTLHSNGYIFLFLLCLSRSSFLSYWEGLLRQPFCLFAFLFLGMVLITASCAVLPTSVHSSSGPLSIRSNPLNLSFTSTV